MNELKNLVQFPANETCPACGKENVTTRGELQTFMYGVEDKAVELEARVRVHLCADCGSEYTGGDAEDARHEAVCTHLGLLPPREIVALRQKYELSRAEFSQLTRIGSASLARWESGNLLQNPAYDNFLYLLFFPDNLERLRRRIGQSEDARTPKVGGKFRSLVLTKQVLHESTEFQLSAP